MSETPQDVLFEVVAGRAPEVFPLTVDQLHQMLAAGILRDGEAVELIGGLLVRKVRGLEGEARVHGPAHANSVARLGRLSPLVEPLRAHLRTQLPLTLSTQDEPEPDGAVVRGSVDDFATA